MASQQCAIDDAVELGFDLEQMRRQPVLHVLEVDDGGVAGGDVELERGEILAQRSVLLVVLPTVRLQEPEQAAKRRQLDGGDPPDQVHVDLTERREPGRENRAAVDDGWCGSAQAA